MSSKYQNVTDYFANKKRGCAPNKTLDPRLKTLILANDARLGQLPNYDAKLRKLLKSIISK
jgi:septum formation topological specificity factor MinE